MLVSADPWLQQLVELLAGRLDMNRRLAGPPAPVVAPTPRRPRRSREQAISEATDRWAFRFRDSEDLRL